MPQISMPPPGSACRGDQRGQGLGRLLLGCAVDRCLKARAQVAAFALLVNAKDAAAKAFYLHYGFLPRTSRPLSLLLLLGRSGRFTGQIPPVHATLCRPQKWVY